MAPDRGPSTDPDDLREDPDNYESDDRAVTTEQRDDRYEVQKELYERGNTPQNFTIRGIVLGLLIGLIICFSNMYFGLQTGWISGMSMPSALIGFAFFKTLARYFPLPFTPVENVLIQSVAGSVGTMPLGCGFVGVIPALDYLLKPEENGPLHLSLWKLIVWAVGICFFGVVFAVPLRKQVIIREKLKFPTGTATALMIGVLHGETKDAGVVKSSISRERRTNSEESERLITAPPPGGSRSDEPAPQTYPEENSGSVGLDPKSDWKAKIKLLIISFSVSAVYTLMTYFIPQIRDVPILGTSLAKNWLWTLNPSPAYMGQGIIMGPATTLHMLLGAVVGWGILSPLAKRKGWAPGPVGDWATGSKGWIVWISLAVMLADSVVSLGWLVLRPVVVYARVQYPVMRDRVRTEGWHNVLSPSNISSKGYAALRNPSSISTPFSETFGSRSKSSPPNDEADVDAPPSQLISNRTVVIGLVLSLGLSIAAIHYVFANLIPFPLTLLALALALILSVMGVRALGETDLNPVSGISKLTQLFFALIVPTNNKNAIIINLVAGALSESGALQSGDLLQDLKTGHLLGAAPKAQFWGQMIGSAVGAVASAGIYKLYTRVYEIPGGIFQVPTGYVWIFTARLVTGQGLPPKVGEWAAGAASLFAAATCLRVWGNSRQAGWIGFVPGGIAVAVGMYNVPSFTLARTIGGLTNWYWRSYRKGSETPLIILASGLILGEGVFSIVNLLLASLNVPHL